MFAFECIESLAPSLLSERHPVLGDHIGLFRGVCGVGI